MKTFKNLMKSRFLLVFLIVVSISCKQNNASNKLQASSTGLEIKSEIINDSLDITIKELMTKHSVPGVNVAIIKKGQLSYTRNYGVLQKGVAEEVNDETMFSMGSISKFVNAIIILKLVKEGKLNLDENVNNYLLQWKVKDNSYTEKKPVTLRGILSHTAGLSVHGFEDYLPEEPIPNTIQILNGEKPAKNSKVEVIYPVGSRFQYSGGGITICQKIIEDVTGLSYPEAAEQILFKPLGLKRTSYENPLPLSFDNVAKAHDGNGNAIALPRGYQTMPETAASGLWTTLIDFSKLLALIKSKNRNDSSNFLSPELIDEMVTEQHPGTYGLGPKIIQVKGKKVIEHGGSNDSYKAIFIIFWEKESGYILQSNGSNGMDLIVEALPFLDTYVNQIVN